MCSSDLIGAIWPHPFTPTSHIPAIARPLGMRLAAFLRYGYPAAGFARRSSPPRSVARTLASFTYAMHLACIIWRIEAAHARIAYPRRRDRIDRRSEDERDYHLRNSISVARSSNERIAIALRRVPAPGESPHTTTAISSPRVGMLSSNACKRNGKLLDRKSTRLNSSHSQQSRMPSSA